MVFAKISIPGLLLLTVLSAKKSIREEEDTCGIMSNISFHEEDTCAKLKLDEDVAMFGKKCIVSGEAGPYCETQARQYFQVVSEQLHLKETLDVNSK